MIKKIYLASLFFALPILAIPGVGLTDPETFEEYELCVYPVGNDRLEFVFEGPVEGINLPNNPFLISSIEREIANRADLPVDLRQDLGRMLNEGFSSKWAPLEFLKAVEEILNRIHE